jgi:hypothetical protein
MEDQAFVDFITHANIPQNVARIDGISFGTQTIIQIESLISATLNGITGYLMLNSLNIAERVHTLVAKPYGMHTVVCFTLQNAISLTRRETDFIQTRARSFELTCGKRVIISCRCTTPYDSICNVSTSCDDIRQIIVTCDETITCSTCHTVITAMPETDSRLRLLMCGHITCIRCIQESKHKFYLEHYNQIAMHYVSFQLEISDPE